MNPGKDAWIGVLGGGQLGRMLSLSARKMGFHVLAWTGGDRSGAASTADRIIDQSFDDSDAMEEFTNSVRVATVEFENLPIDTLKKVEDRIPLRPGSHAISICQHREREKRFLSDNGFGCANFSLAHDLDSFTEGLSKINSPVIVKTAEFGYDGKGQLRLPAKLSATDIDDAWKQFEGGRVVIEECITLEAELSVLVARNPEGKMVHYDPVENIHRNHILDLSIAPARITENYQKLASETALAIANSLEYVGMLAVEFFISSDGRLIVNELAPRPHNSGHHTINACHCSQFEQQARAVCGLPLGSTQLVSPVIMMNLLGDVWKDEFTPPDWEKILEMKGTSLHLYGKRKARQGRKMGHITIMGDSTEECLLKTRSIRKELNLPDF
jgi:5-(carboxyamino)imidazole ribonucleotide synthase